MINDYYPDLLYVDIPEDSSPAKGHRPVTHQIVIGATNKTFLGTSHQARPSLLDGNNTLGTSTLTT
eukprot:114660-Rhodomonas_salina.2